MKKKPAPPPAKSAAELRDDAIALSLYRVLQQGSARYAGGLPQGWGVDDVPSVQGLRAEFEVRFPQMMVSLKTRTARRKSA